MLLCGFLIFVFDELMVGVDFDVFDVLLCDLL